MLFEKKIPQFLILLIKIFLIGLLLQFFLHTFFTYKLGFVGKFWDFFRLWKELIIVILSFAVGYYFFFTTAKKSVSASWKRIVKHPIFPFFLAFLAFILISFILAIVIQKVGIWTWILSLKYDLIWFFLVLLGVALMWFVPRLSQVKWTRWYQKLFPALILFSLGWWMVLLVAPGFFRLFGYSPSNFEWTIGEAPPAGYYTDISRWAVRSQFLFERPISWWFFLVAFWPLFALVTLRKQSRKKQIWRTLLFGLAVFSTFSRAAIGVWMLESAVIFLVFYHKNLKKLFLYFGIPVLILSLGVFVYFKDAFSRVHSNTGHAVLLKEGWKLTLQHPLVGRWAGYSGPASHQICYHDDHDERCEIIRKINTQYEISTYGYNPENQYIQILMEYGFLWFIPWIFMLVWMLWYSLRFLRYAWLELQKGKKSDQALLSRYFLFWALGLGLFALVIEGVVLHSLVDRMIVYPFMLLFGMAYGRLFPLWESDIPLTEKR